MSNKIKKNEKVIITKIIFGVIIGVVVFISWLLIGQLDKFGKALGFILYFSVISYGLFEYAKVLSFSTWICCYFALLPIISFFNPWDLTFNWFLGQNQPSLAQLILNQYQYTMFGIVGLGYLVQAILVLIPFLFLKNLAQMKKLIFYLISYVVVIILTITSKSFVYINSGSMLFLLALFLGQITCDSFAYFGGLFLGNKIFSRKLAPKISPKKTIEGAIIGFLVSWFVTFLIFWFVKFEDLNVDRVVLVVVIPILVPILAILGDLAFSGIKRLVKIKDFSNLLPGHGGILDRIDSIALVSFVFISLFIVI